MIQLIELPLDAFPLIALPIAAADWGDIIRLLVIFGIVGFSVISKIINGAAAIKGPRPPAGGQPQLQPRPGQQPMGQPQARGGRPNVDDEIEEFLRQARGRGEANPPQPPEPPQPVRRASLPQQPNVHVRPGEGFGENVTSHVREHLHTDSILERDAHLAEVVEEADERIEAHLEDVFDHEVGRLEHVNEVDTSIKDGTDDSTWDNKVDSNDTADLIRNTLQSPDKIRNVFIISEILKRPEL